MNNVLNLKIGEKSPEIFNAVVEIPKGSQNKYEFDEKTGVFKLDRVLYSPTHYPTDYGFIPETRSQDGDHLDVLIIGGYPLFVGCVLVVRPVGILKMVDNGDEDFKILGVQAKNPRLDAISDIKDIEASNPHLLKEIAHFFQVYKELEGKQTRIIGWEGVEKAKEEIIKARDSYRDETVI
ncbi:MAG: inorganic diphosphatase [Patescibacteria group bacterium]